MNIEPISLLAQTYQQIYLDPDKPESAEEYKNIVLRGYDAPVRSLSHFITDDRDVIEMVETPAGSVRVVTLHKRKDFETFLHIMAGKCDHYDIPASQGAAILNGVINWQKIRKHKEEWLKEQDNKNLEITAFHDWNEEFKRFTSDKENFKDALIILSAGPYSNVPASEFGFSEEEWQEKSIQIRKYHECTHFLCRRKYPELIDAIWDEAVADAAGLIAAFGKLDVRMEEKFLGVGRDGYTGGRLRNYVGEDEDINSIAVRIYSWLEHMAAIYEEYGHPDAFGFVVIMEEKYKTILEA